MDTGESDAWVDILGGSSQVVPPGHAALTKMQLLMPHTEAVLTWTWAKAISGLDVVLSTEHLHDALNEQFLWHGTLRSAAENIVQNDFHIPSVAEIKHGTRFGVGAYFAENLDKSLAYAPSEDGIQTVLLCRVLCGRMHRTSKERDPDAMTVALNSKYDSVLATPDGDYREFIIPAADHVYPEYILELESS